MKHSNFITLILCLCLILCLPACGNGVDESSVNMQPTDPESVSPPQIHTYNYYDCDFLSSTPDKKAYETDVTCTAMQGMAASDQYIYTAKQKNDQYANIFQYDTVSGAHRMLTYYKGTDTPTLSPIDCVAHCNDMDVYDDADGSRYLLCATARTPSSSSPKTCLVRFLLDEENAAIYDRGYYNLTRYNQWGSKDYVAAGSIRKVAESDSFHYFLVKDANDFLWFKIPVNDAGGGKYAPTELECVLLFTIDNRNALFSNKMGELFTVQNLESWTNQGFCYSYVDDLIYVQLYNPSIGNNAGYENVIVTFHMDGMLEADKLEAVTEDRELIVYPTNLSFYLTDPKGKFFELESSVFLQNQGEDGDHRLYFNTNASDVKSFEGVWVTDYEEGSVDVQPLVTEDSIVYTVEYNYNVFAVDKSQWLTNAENYHFYMDPTIHISGIVTSLRINTFIRTGYEFEGWYLHRASDNKWMCTDGAWYTEDSIPAGAEKQLFLDTEPVDKLTEVNGDTITAYVQWVKK